MISNPVSAPPPNLRIVRVEEVRPHEKGDVQRSQPLMERLRRAEHFTNPPVVAEIAQDNYVLMDGSNRHISLQNLGFKHILVQIADYESDCVELGVWQHIVADWDSQRFMKNLEAMDNIVLKDGWNANAVAHALLRDGPVYSIHAGVDNLKERNATLRQVVESYHNNAALYRSPLTDPALIWTLFPSGVALVLFPPYQPQDIIDAALQAAYLPPGVSRHMIHGRALNLNFPMDGLRSEIPLAEKNQRLQDWLREQYAQRSVRYYAEATYHFDE
ncbi:MAG: hypothetical protein OXN88_15655 [Chloroflexota bacterium]|nr:hypothetical protein [Chloroflexota bacterium]